MIEELKYEEINIEIGTGTYASSKPLLRRHHENNKIIIGKYCSLAHNVTIFAGGNHPLKHISTHPLKLYFEVDDFNSWTNDCPDNSETTTIGNDVWIGHEALILSGVNIGSGAIIGARSVVTKDVKPYAIVAGSPAKVIRYRFKKRIIKKLLEISWWDWDEKTIKENVDIICSDNVQRLGDLIR